MAALVDSSVLIAGERGELDLARFVEQHGKTALALSAISASELLHGIHRLRASSRKIRAEVWVQAILDALPVLPFDLACVRAHARLGAELARRGVTLGAHELMIGASALALGYSVMTRDRRSFPKIPDLESPGVSADPPPAEAGLASRRPRPNLARHSRQRTRDRGDTARAAFPSKVTQQPSRSSARTT